MKVIFLDFDGVMNPENNYKPDCVFSKSAVKNLNKLLAEAPDAKIVVSSAWRHKGLEFVKDTLSKNGIDSERVTDITDLVHRNDRGHHIERYLKDHKEIKQFVILDDRNDMDKVLDHLVKISFMVGITSKDVKKALAILSDLV